MEKTFLVFWVFVLFHPIFFAFPPKAISWDFFLSMLGVCVLVCVRLGYFIYFLCFEPPVAISSGLLLLLCWRKHFGLFLVFELLHSIFFAFPPLKRFRGTSPSFVLEEAFWLMLGTVLFSSLLPPPSGFRVLEFLQGWSWGWPELSEPGVGVGVQPQP